MIARLERDGSMAISDGRLTLVISDDGHGVSLASEEWSDSELELALEDIDPMHIGRMRIGHLQMLLRAVWAKWELGMYDQPTRKPGLVRVK